MWESYTGEAEQANGSSHTEEGPLQAETTTVSVTDVNDATLFYFQVRLGAVLTQMPQGILNAHMVASGHCSDKPYWHCKIHAEMAGQCLHHRWPGL